MSLELVPLCTGTLKLDELIDVGLSPTGRRVVVGVVEARFEGERFNASLAGHASADWLTTSATPAVATPDVRMTLKTDDGVLVFIHYQGRADFSAGPAGASYYTAPKFEVGDPRYGWLAAIQAVGKGTLSADLRTMVHEIYEVR